MQNSVVRQFMQKKNFSSHHNDTAEIELDGSTISQNEEASMLRRLPISGRDTFEGPATSTIGQSAISGATNRQIDQESSVGAFQLVSGQKYDKKIVAKNAGGSSTGLAYAERDYEPNSFTVVTNRQ